MKIKINRKNFKWYLILFPFLHPRGFSEYFPIYKNIMTIWLYIAVFGIVTYFIFSLGNGKVKVTASFFCVLLYFGVMLTETLLLQGKLGEGLQKMFATPALCMFFILVHNRSMRYIIDVIANILLFNSFLNCIVFNPMTLRYLMGNEYIENLSFIGHVQICAQIGTLGIMVAYLIIRFGDLKKGIVLILLSLMTMLISAAIASYVAIIIIVVAYLFYNFGEKAYFARISPKFIFLAGTVLQILVIPVVIYYRIDFQARYYVWFNAISQLPGHFLTGFGVYGVLIWTFWMEWTGSSGMNYAHNEVLQILLDGGIILLLCYVLMVTSLLKKYSSNIDSKTRYWVNCLLLVFLIDGICESVTEYNFFYIFLLIISFLPKIHDSFMEEYTQTKKCGEI